MNTAEDIKRMLGELVDEAIRIGRAEGEKALGTDAQLKEQVKRLTDDKRKLTQNLDHVIEENNDLELTIGRLRATLEKAENENEMLRAEVAGRREPTPAACPFCGGRPDVVAINKERWVVTCHSDTCAVNPETDAFDMAEEAVSAWNHRAGGLTCDWR